MFVNIETSAISVISGGTHSDGLTYNALVIFADGVYLELIAFIHEVDYYEPGSPQRLARENHYWAKREPGWIDWAHLDPSPPPSDLYRLINHRAPSGNTLYLPPRAGGRIREDGIEIKWAVTPVAPDQKSGNIPFFCEDITPRRLRVRLANNLSFVSPLSLIVCFDCALLADNHENIHTNH